MDLKHAFGRNILISGFANAVSLSKGIVILPLISKMLGTEIYGMWSQLSVTITLIGPLCLLGLQNAVVRFLSKKEKDKKIISEGILLIS